jgi:hypothetical protein
VIVVVVVIAVSIWRIFDNDNDNDNDNEETPVSELEQRSTRGMADRRFKSLILNIE